MRLERTLPAVWQLTGADVPALAPVTSRARVVVVDDVELLCASIVVDVSRSDAPYVPSETSDLYEALAFLLGRVVEVLPRYDPSRGRRVHDPWTAGFKAWLHHELAKDLIDQWRSWFGRFGQKKLPRDQSETREANGVRSWWVEERDDARGVGERRSRGALHQDQGDRGDSWLDDLRRGFLEGRDRALLREVEALGLGPVARDGGRAARARRAAQGRRQCVRAA